jgi:phosphate transport system substrate-binding protein
MTGQTQIKRGRFATGLLCACVGAALGGVHGGCARLRALAPGGMRSELGGPAVGHRIAGAELDELTRAFADRYVGLLSSTCDALKKDNPDPVQRREAQELTLNAATNVYDIASNADAFTRMLDLVVVTTLLSQVWVDDDRAGDVFGGRGEVLVRALHHGRVEAWALAARVLRPDQLDVLDYAIWDWRRQNPDMVRASFVRFSNFALDRGKSANAEVLAAGGFFKNIGQTGQSVDEARLLTERMFYRLKREPTLLRWQVEAAKDNALATPEVGKALADVHRITEQAERLPGDVAAERRAILAAVDERQKSVEAMLAGVRGAISEAKELAVSVGKSGGEVDAMLKTGGTLFTQFDAWDRWTTGRPGHRTFDVREYTQGMKELSAAVGTVNESLKSSHELLGSPEWGRRIEDVTRSADGRMRVAAEQSQLLVNATFVRACLLMAVFFTLLVLYRLVTLLLARRLSAEGVAAGAAAGNGRGVAAGAGVRRRRRDVGMTLLLWIVPLLGAAYALAGCSAAPVTDAGAERAGIAGSAGDVELPSAGAGIDGLPSYVPVTGLSGKVISVGASTTTNLVARAASEFRRMYPGVNLQVTAGLTSIGPPALVEGKADVVPMSRPLLPEEIESFRAKHGYAPTEIKVAADALAIYVEKRNPVEGLTLAQLDGIFSRTRRRGGPAIETWGQVGLTGEWAGRAIPLYGYGPTDGVHQVFRQAVLAGGEYRLSLQVVPAGSLIVQDVAADPAAIGCASIFFASRRTRAVPLAGEDGRFYAPTDENVRSRQYPLTRFITICVNKPPGRPLAPATAEFLRYLLSPEGQQIVAAGGNVRLDAATAGQGRRAIE